MSKIIVLTAPSGSGKTTIARRVMEAIPEMKFSVSATTRPRRDYEVDGVHYHFVTEEQFRQHIAEGSLIEYEEVYPGRLYGTLRDAVDRVAQTNPVLLDIDVKGALNVQELYNDDAFTLFIRPPSLAILEERLRNRQTEDEETLRVRLDRAQTELTYADRFDAVVVNDDLEKAVEEALKHIVHFLNQ